MSVVDSHFPGRVSRVSALSHSLAGGLRPRQAVVEIGCSMHVSTPEDRCAYLIDGKSKSWAKPNKGRHRQDPTGSGSGDDDVGRAAWRCDRHAFYLRVLWRAQPWADFRSVFLYR